ncbi:hypothetical protein SH528x_004271 [Novipirellula sp. SH528]|uniref:hypothetical protein n=1 Tax=Novipirellula sp. SH528 TaxID=3454466 RepID=UPI003F9EBCF3
MRFSVFMLTVLIPLAAASVLDAQDANEQASSVREPVFDIGKIEVPEGSTADVLEFLQNTHRRMVNKYNWNCPRKVDSGPADVRLL